MVSRLVTAAAVLLAAGPGAAAAQDALTIDQAVAAALAKNAGLKAAEAGVRESAARVEEARAAYLPRLDYIGSLLSQRRFAAANFALDALNHPDPLTNYHGAFALQQPVYDSHRIAGIQSASIGNQVAQQVSAEARADLALGVTRVYGGVLQAIAGRKAADAAVETARDDLARTEQRRDAGLATEADVLSLKVFLAQMQERQIRAASGEAIARAQLNQLIGTALDQAFALVEPAPVVPSTPDPAGDEAEALRSRPAIKRADAQLALADVNRSAARWAFLPQAYFQAMYDFNGHSFTDRASSWLVAGQIRINLFAGLGDSARLKAATEAQVRASAERANLVNTVRVEVRTARAELDAALAREAVGRAAILQARESQRIIRDRYESGLAGVSDVLRAANALLDAEALRTASIVDVMVGRAAFDRAVGRTR
jgi:outer membrane protein TolC